MQSVNELVLGTDPHYLAMQLSQKRSAEGKHSSPISCDYNHLDLLLDFMPYQQDHNHAPGL